MITLQHTFDNYGKLPAQPLLTGISSTALNNIHYYNRFDLYLEYVKVSQACLN